MKRLFAISLVMVLTSCGATLEPPQDAQTIIGNPIKIGNLLVAQYDFTRSMNWEDAKIVCDKLGKGWRLPTRKELTTLYWNKNKIGNFTDNDYWSSTESGVTSAFYGDFEIGGQDGTDKFSMIYVRAVKSF
jgi:hypothetical protein